MTANDVVMKITSDEVLKRMHQYHNDLLGECPVCNKRTGSTAAVYVVHVTELCNCDVAPWEHLVYVPYHMECWATIAERRGKEAARYRTELGSGSRHIETIPHGVGYKP